MGGAMKGGGPGPYARCGAFGPVALLRRQLKLP